MKVFGVSKACNACGECTLSTDLLIEDAQGYAKPAPGRYIEENEASLSAAKQLVEQCPMGALSIREQRSVFSEGKQGLELLTKALKRRMDAVPIPDISFRTLEFRAKDYHVEHESVDERKNQYASFEQAVRAGQEQFKRVYWNHMQDFVASALTQYKSRMLRQYYDLSDLQHTYYAEIGRKMTKILQEIQAEACSLSGGTLNFPADFAQFCPEEDRQFRRELQEEYTQYMVSPDYIKKFCDAFAAAEEKQQRDFQYKGWICAEQFGQIPVKGLFGKTIWKPAYRMTDVNKAGESMMETLLMMLTCPEDYGLQSLDDYYANDLARVMEQYRVLVTRMIAEKVAIFQKVAGLSC